MKLSAVPTKGFPFGWFSASIRLMLAGMAQFSGHFKSDIKRKQ